MEQRVSLVTLGVADLRRARTFYEALGWRRANDDDEVDFYQSGGMVVALWDRAELATDSRVTDTGGWGGVTLAHNVRSPSEVDAVLAEAIAAGDLLGRVFGRLHRPRRPSLGGRPQPRLGDRRGRLHPAAVVRIAALGGRLRTGRPGPPRYPYGHD
jgi:catechol 2,3-dioxygenase-like lactoylglutathione lyase family enzyme